MSEDIRTILAELKDDHSISYDIYKSFGGDTFTIDLIEEFNNHPLVIEKNKKIEENREIKIVQQMTIKLLMFLDSDHQPLKVGNSFEKANKKLKQALSILEELRVWSESNNVQIT